MEVENSTKRGQFQIEHNVRWHVIDYFECCHNQQQTADHFDTHQSSVSRILSKFQITGDVKNYQKSGRNHILGNDEECSIEEMVQKNRYSITQEIIDNLEVSRNIYLKSLCNNAFNTFKKELKRFILQMGAYIENLSQNLQKLQFCKY